jgi:hypothetical protein
MRKICLDDARVEPGRDGVGNFRYAAVAGGSASTA